MKYLIAITILYAQCLFAQEEPKADPVEKKAIEKKEGSDTKAAATEAEKKQAAAAEEARNADVWEFDFAPFFQVEKRKDGIYRRGFGPIFEKINYFDGRIIYALRPLVTVNSFKPGKFLKIDLLFPIWSYAIFGQRSIQKGLLSQSMNKDIDDPESARQSYLLPLYCYGISTEGVRYFALFPIGGVVHEFAGYDKMSFVLFPLYLKTIKNEHTKAVHLLFPFYTNLNGKGLRKFNFFPFWGYSRKEGKWKNTFVLWPFFQWGYSLDATKPGGGFVILPFYGHIKYQTAQKGLIRNTTFLWPFFSWLRNENFWRLHAPWPFFQRSKNMYGPNSSRLFLFPFWGLTKRDKIREMFVLWPFYQYYYEPSTDVTRTRSYIVPFWMRFTEEYPDGRKNVYQRLWPLASIARKDGEKRIKILDIFPMRNLEIVERNLDPLWTLYSYHSKKDASRHDLLWGLWQFRKKGKQIEKHSLFPFYYYEKPAEKKRTYFSLLKGLYAYDRRGKDRYTKVLWFIKWRHKSKSQEDAAEEENNEDAVEKEEEKKGDPIP